jgi:hypothetical protein
MHLRPFITVASTLCIFAGNSLAIPPPYSDAELEAGATLIVNAEVTDVVCVGEPAVKETNAGTKTVSTYRSTLSVISTAKGMAPTPLFIEGTTTAWSPGSNPPIGGWTQPALKLGLKGTFYLKPAGTEGYTYVWWNALKEADSSVPGDLPDCAGGCTPDCDNKTCGDDGCGDICGTCGEDAPVCQSGTCISDFCQAYVDQCVPPGDPEGMASCQDLCEQKKIMTTEGCWFWACGVETGKCDNQEANDQSIVDCGIAHGWFEPNCQTDCTGKKCGDDLCGGSCGECAEGETCNDEGQCTGACVPNCADMDGNPLTCGGDGCGGDCGACGIGQVCIDGVCGEMPCDGDCLNKECGDDGCGFSCGDCAQGETCSDDGQCGACVPNCTMETEDGPMQAVCGNDGCGGSCGGCNETISETCQDGLCVSGGCDPIVVPGEQMCGMNGCGSDWGDCSESQICGPEAYCIDAVDPSVGDGGGGCRTGDGPVSAGLLFVFGLALLSLFTRARRTRIDSPANPLD